VLTTIGIGPAALLAFAVNADRWTSDSAATFWHMPIGGILIVARARLVRRVLSQTRSQR
jgi:hypothetical protein